MITLKQTTTAKELLDQKGHGVISISPSATVYDAIKKMADNDVGSLVVTNDITVVEILNRTALC